MGSIAPPSTAEALEPVDAAVAERVLRALAGPDAALRGDQVTAFAALVARVRATIRSDLSTRHVPDEIVTVNGIPRTWSGKRIEVPIKRLMTAPTGAGGLDRASIANPEALAGFSAYAAQLATDRERASPRTIGRRPFAEAPAFRRRRPG